MSVTTTQLLSSSEFYKLRYDTIPVKNASANISFYTSNSKNQILSCDPLVAMSDIVQISLRSVFNAMNTIFSEIK